MSHSFRMAATVPVFSFVCRGTATWVAFRPRTVCRPPSRTMTQPLRRRKRTSWRWLTSRGSFGIHLDGLQARVPGQGFVASDLEDEVDGVLDVGQGLLHRLPLRDGAGELDALHREPA